MDKIVFNNDTIVVSGQEIKVNNLLVALGYFLDNVKDHHISEELAIGEDEANKIIELKAAVMDYMTKNKFI